jgi:hypothetical protein
VGKKSRLVTCGVAAAHRTWIEKVLWTVVAEGPAATKYELNSQNVTGFTLNAVANLSRVDSIRVMDLDFCARRNFALHLEAGAGERNVVQVSDNALKATLAIAPSDVNQVGAEHSLFNSSVLHENHIGCRKRSKRNIYGRFRSRCLAQGLRRSMVNR